MNDSEILNRIDELVAEEHRLYDKEGSGDFEPVATGCGWTRSASRSTAAGDLLRQRRARREFGLDPDEAQARSADTVEHYEQ